MRQDHLERFDKAAAAFAGYVQLGRGSVTFLLAIFAGHILGTELSGDSVYCDAIIWNALALALYVFPILAVCFFLLMFTEVSRIGILYVTLVSTTLASALEVAHSRGRSAFILITVWVLVCGAVAYAYSRMRASWT